MRSLNFVVAMLCLGLALSAALSQAQITPAADSYTYSGAPGTNYGASGVLYVDAATENTFIQFNLASVPSGTSVEEATLKLYVNSVTTAGSFNVYNVLGSWAENTITWNLSPTYGSAVASNVTLTTASKNQYILVDVTSAVQAWLNGSETNDGIALVANGTFNASFDSKENTNTSHPAELDLVFGSSASITGITTASDSGLTGGGTSGNLNLSLTTSCAAGQVLEWNGSSWACTSLTGGGTITGVTAGYGLLGGGTSGNVTLSVNPTAIALVTNGPLSNTGVGISALSANTTGSFNTATGGPALDANTTGSYNTANGANALTLNTTGSQNTGIGALALYANTSGSYNTSTGAYSLYTNTTGFNNTATGASALYYNTSGYGNTATGEAALSYNSNCIYNNATGYSALGLNTTGSANIADGASALEYNSIGNFNAAFGYAALSGNTTGNNNTAVGYASLDGNQIGSYNTAVGAEANVQSNANANEVTLLGANTNALGSISYATAIGAGAVVSESNAVVLGGTVGSPYAVNVGIGTAAPTRPLHIAQYMGHALADGWDTYSSRRWKTNIQTLPDALAKVEQLRGVSYDLKGSGKHEIGVIAEEVGAVVPEVVSWEDNGKDARGVDYSRLVALLIEATKEQQALIRQQQEHIRKQQQELRLQRSRIDHVSQELQQVKTAVNISRGSASIRSSKATLQ